MAHYIQGLHPILLSAYTNIKTDYDIKSFTSRYNVKQLVYYEIHNSITSAIEREKQIKDGSRKKKLKLIEDKNPKWIDLYNSLL